MFGIVEMAEQLRWHQANKSQDNKLRHHVDSVAWETIDRTYPLFASDPRNIRFGLSTDGFNPFQDRSTTYSCWPVILVIYNFPPWLCMSKENLMLSLVIPGPKQPGNEIDVYLAPLIEDLQELWLKGVEVFEEFSKTRFNLRAILMWTIHDFPAYGNISGWPTKGKCACPLCRGDTCSEWLPYSKKFAYMGHRKFLSPAHPLRSKKQWFNGLPENGGCPRVGTGDEIYLEVNEIVTKWGKLGKKRKRNDDACSSLWKKSIFWDLPYWKVWNIDIYIFSFSFLFIF